MIDSKNIPQVTLSDGSKLPCIGMGTFGSDHASPEQVSNAVAGALRMGYRLFDCASVYGNEAQIGEIFTNAIDSKIVSREELFVISKLWNDMHGKGDVLLSLAKTLKDLQFDYIDCYFIHWPFPNYHPPGCDADTRSADAVPFSVDNYMMVWKQMERLVDMGLARYIGMSNMTIPKLDAVLPLCRVKPALLEAELHPCFQQPELFDYCKRSDIGIIGFCPVGSPTRPDRDKSPGDLSAIEMPEIVEIAKAHGVHPAIICLKWAIKRGQIPIPFSVNENEYISNLRCVFEAPLTDAEMEKIKSADKNNRLIKGQVFLWESAKGWEDLWDLDGTICK